MSGGMGPASCWVTHKRLESWARAAKERALGSTSPKNSDSASTSSNSLEVTVIDGTPVLDGANRGPSERHYATGSCLCCCDGGDGARDVTRDPFPVDTSPVPV